MKNLEVISEVLTTTLTKDPMFVLALGSLLLVGFAIYAVLAIVKLLTKREGR